MTVNISEMTDTWNSGATVFTAIKMNVTDTASDAASLLMDLQIGSSPVFRVGKDTLEKMRGTNAQSLYVYNTYTDASNYERLEIKYTANTATIGPVGAGTGSNFRDLVFARGGAEGLRISGTQVTISKALRFAGTSPNIILDEDSGPPTAIANAATLFSEDDGSGKTRLMVLFGTGAAQQIAIEL